MLNALGYALGNVFNLDGATATVVNWAALAAVGGFLVRLYLMLGGKAAAGKVGRLELYARAAFEAIEAAAAALGLESSADKLEAYMEELGRLLRGAGLPWGAKEKAHAKAIAATMAKQAKRRVGPTPTVLDRLAQAREVLVSVKEE